MSTPHPQLWFKILHSNGQAIDESQESWSLPVGKENGRWVTFRQQIAPVNTNGTPPMYGTWLVVDPKPLYSQFKESKIYVAQWRGEFIELQEGMLWVSEVRLLREATNLDLRPFGIYRTFQQIL